MIIKEYQKLCEILNSNQLFVTKFDTIPGIFGKANKENFEKINKIKKRHKNLILIFQNLNQVLEYFDLSEKQISIIKKLQNFHTSFKVLKKRLKEEYKEQFYSLNESLVFRIYFPYRWIFSQRKSGFFCNKVIRNTNLLLKTFGPFFTTSCNYDGNKPKRSFNSVRRFSKENGIFFADLFFRNLFPLGKPSSIVDIEDPNFLILRKGIRIRKINKKIKKLLNS